LEVEIIEENKKNILEQKKKENDGEKENQDGRQA
jgi:hypothetical protein